MSKGRLKLAAEFDADSGALMAGEIAGMISEIKSVREIIDEIVFDNFTEKNTFQNDTIISDERVTQFLKHKPPILLVDKIDK